jgi:exodeoxyribonuclease V gamma subunit
MTEIEANRSLFEPTAQGSRNLSLQLYTSNRLEILAEKLAEVVRRPLDSVLEPEIIVVQSQGMARWLQLELARTNGICANCRFPFPNAFSLEMFQTVLEGEQTDPAYERDVLVWRLLKLLQENRNAPGFESVNRYLGSGTDPRKAYQLAQKIACLFDQYIIFRPDLVLAWEEGKETYWQAVLWRELAREIGSPHSAVLRKRFAENLRSGNLSRENLPGRFSVFGISALPPFHLEIISALASLVEVHFFLLQPSREFWGEIVSERETERMLKIHKRGAGEAEELHLERGNRLLASMGQQGRDFLKLIGELGDPVESAEFIDPGAGSLLHAIQSDILNLRDRGSGGAAEGQWGRDGDGRNAGEMDLFSFAAAKSEVEKLCISEQVQSIQIHSCHSPLREMEILYDHLLDWFAKDPDLAPRDILVMAPDIGTYGPFIEAVFHAPEEERRRIPFSLADRGLRQQSHLTESFLGILNLSGSRYGFGTVLQLLEEPALRRKFSLTEADVEMVRVWLQKSGVRWGIDRAHRQSLGLPDLDGNSWREGINRLLLGYAMAGGGERLFEGVLPFDEVEGTTTAALGHFVEFAERLFEQSRNLEEARPLIVWQELLLEILNQFFLPEETEERELKIVRGALADLGRAMRLSGYKERVELAVVLEKLHQVFEQDHFGAGFLTGGVTFCALKPMRSIPAKIICLVGMNDAAFPRRSPQLGFDLMAGEPKLGDRSSREDDRYLFLETLLSARERLYISYVGQSVRDNSHAPPSVVVSELWDAIEQGYELEGKPAREQILVQHRLQPFSEAYFSGEKLFSYSEENCRASEMIRRPRESTALFLKEPLPEPEEEWREVNLEDLVRFFCHPAKYFVTRRLGLALLSPEEGVEETEPFSVEGLEAYQLREKMVTLRLGGHLEMEPLVKNLGGLPLGKVGEISYRKLAAEVEQFLRSLEPLHPRESSPLEIDLPLGAFRVRGRLNRITSEGALHYRCSDIKAKDVLRAWLPHLAWNIQNGGGVSFLAGTDRVLRYAPAANAGEQLEELLELYWRGLSEPLRFFPDSARAFALAECDPEPGKKKRNALFEAGKIWQGNDGPWGRPGEREDLYYDLCFRNLEDPLDELFQELARQVFVPILDCEGEWLSAPKSNASQNDEKRA